MNIAELFLRCKKVLENTWTEFTFVFEFGEGHISNSGFLYTGDKVRPATASIEEDRLLLGNTLEQLREDIYQQCGKKFNQLLFQMENETKHFKIDFEFDDQKRWVITPNNMLAMREKLRPKVD